jgi:hypothetical protein
MWLAELITSARSAERGQSTADLCDWGAAGQGFFDAFIWALSQNSIYHPKLAPLSQSMAAASFQWLSDIPPDRLSVCQGLVHVCRAANHACSYGYLSCIQGGAQQVTGGSELFASANRAVAQQSAAALAKVLKIARGAADGVGSRLVDSISRDRGSNIASNLTECCQCIAPVLARAAQLAAISTAAQAELPVQVQGPRAYSTGFNQSQPEGSGSVLQMPVQHAKCCKLLQDCVRLAAAATAAVPNKGIEEFMSFSSMLQISDLLESVGLLLRRVQCQSDRLNMAPEHPLVASVAAAGVCSPDGLQLFGLLCSLLKVYSNGSSSMTYTLLQLELSSDSSASGNVQPPVHTTTAVLAAVADVLIAGLSSCSSSGDPLNSSNSSAGSSACIAALPWLVLLGRCCCTCAVLMQHCQRLLQSDDAATTFRPQQWAMHQQP